MASTSESAEAIASRRRDRILLQKNQTKNIKKKQTKSNNISLKKWKKSQTNIQNSLGESFNYKFPPPGFVERFSSPKEGLSEKKASRAYDFPKEQPSRPVQTSPENKATSFLGSAFLGSFTKPNELF